MNYLFEEADLNGTTEDNIMENGDENDEDKKMVVDIGAALIERKLGFFIQDDSEEFTALYYHVIPDENNLIFISKYTIIPEVSSFLKTLCERAEISRGISSTWICEMKDSGRLKASCNRSGLPRLSRYRPKNQSI